MGEPQRGEHAEPEAYLAEHVRQALAQDPEVAELDVVVTVAGGRVELSGSVPTAERREAVGRVARETLPDHDVHNRIVVETFPAPARAERVQ